MPPRSVSAARVIRVDWAAWAVASTRDRTSCGASSFVMRERRCEACGTLLAASYAEPRCIICQIDTDINADADGLSAQSAMPLPHLALAAPRRTRRRRKSTPNGDPRP